jgi:cytochrome o ubiquinol oxidase subunit 2
MSTQPVQAPRTDRHLLGFPSMAARCGLLLSVIVLAGCQPAVLDPKGAVGIAQRTILIDSVAIMLAIVIPTILAIAAFGWWFRASNTKARYLPNFAYSGRIEMVTWAIPMLVIFLLGGVAWIGSHDLDPARPLASDAEPLEIQVVSLDWKWLFIYPGQGVGAVNQLVVPAGVPLHFSLTSASVMNAFFIPQLGSMIYTMNGMTTQLNLIADQPGVFRGLSSHYSGDGFADMNFEVRAVTADQFAAWVTTTRGAGPSLTPATYAGLSKQSIKVAPFSYREVDPGMFSKIVSQELPPGPGPDSAPGGTTVSLKAGN